MKVRILPSALRDLNRGKIFYEAQGDGLGEYFTNSLFSDIDSLALHGVSTRSIGVITACWRVVFRMLFTIG